MSVRRPLLRPLVPLYRLAVAAKNRRYDTTGIAKTLRAPVISVGSIAAGGAGKTPFLEALARLLLRGGYAPDVLSRGYGRQSRGVLRVDPAGTARQFGDEPLMLARSLRVPVFVGSSRHAAGLLAEAQDLPGNRVHLLDDGFNHRALARTLDIALLTLEDARDSLLPAGNLREPVEALRRADVLVLRAHEAEHLLPMVPTLVGANKPLWTITRRLALPADVPAYPVVFSAIARPAEFEAMVRRGGVHPVGTRRFADHHTMTEAEVDALRRYGHASHANGFLTTAKDAVKLTPPMLEVLARVGPVAVADAVVDFQDESAVVRHLRGVLGDPTAD